MVLSWTVAAWLMGGIALALVLYTYALYPLLMALLASLRPRPQYPPMAEDEWPELAVLMAVYNEEGTIEHKVRNLFASDYPADRLHFLVGDDCSGDGTLAVLQRLQSEFPRLQVYPMGQRTGKPGIINHLAMQTTAPILVLTDARALAPPDALKHLLAPLADEKVGLVSARLLTAQSHQAGIARQEVAYFDLEVAVKDYESRVLGAMMGAFGSLYALRRSLYRPTPPRFNVDDFYISLQVLAQGYQALLARDALCHLHVNTDIRREFARKTRIATGNFQNLAVLWPLLFGHGFGLSFAFFSHKILRWFTPLILLLLLLAAALLAWQGVALPLYGLLGGLALVGLDLLCLQLGFKLPVVRYFTHFVVMNLALLRGLWRYLSGVRSNVWEPTRRQVG